MYTSDLRSSTLPLSQINLDSHNFNSHMFSVMLNAVEKIKWVIKIDSHSHWSLQAYKNTRAFNSEEIIKLVQSFCMTEAVVTCFFNWWKIHSDFTELITWPEFTVTSSYVCGIHNSPPGNWRCLFQQLFHSYLALLGLNSDSHPPLTPRVPAAC